MYIIKWSNGDVYSQSYKKDKEVEDKQLIEEQQEANTHYSGVSRQYVFKDSYKEEVSHRVGEREHIQQCCVNPYLGMNFVKDLAVQEEYLKPKNSNYSKKK